MSSKISQSDATSKKNKKSKKKKQSSQEETSEESKKAPGSPTSIGSGSKSLVKKLNLGKIYKKKKEQPPTPDKEEPKEPSGVTSHEEVVVQDDLETASSTTASRDTEDDRSSSPYVVTPTKEQKPLEEELPRETISNPLRSEPETPEEETPREEIVSSSREAAEEKKEETPSKEEISEKQEEKEKQEPEEQDKDTLQFQEKLKELDKTMQQVGQSGGDVKRECLYKILVIGELGAGKTSIIKRYVHQFFSQHYRATIGVDFALKVINWDSNTIIRLQLWDIAGQERFGNMTRVYYKEAVGAFIVFDVTRQATFDAVLKWKNDLDSKVQLPDGGHIPCVLLANKCDQQKEGIVNSANKMEEYCKENHFSAWYETSAKENINIEEAAKTLVSQILSNDLSDNGKGYGSGKDNGKFPLDSNPDSTSDRRGCSC